MGQLQRKKGVGPVAPANNIALWMIIGRGSIIATSPTGEVWTAVTAYGGTVGGIAYGTGIAYNSGVWVATGVAESYSQTAVATSTDGITWNKIIGQYEFGGITAGYKVIYANGYWVVACNGPVIIYTTTLNPTATSWTIAARDGQYIYTIGGLTDARSIAYGNGMWVAIGDAGNQTCIAWSTNLSNWYAVSLANSGGLNRTGNDVAYGNGMWVAISSWQHRMAYSSNGTSWTEITNTGNMYNGKSIAYGNGLWVAVGQTISTSTSGTSFNEVPQANRAGTHNEIILAVAYNNGIWIASGQTFIIYSTNGTGWTAVPIANRGGITNGWRLAWRPPLGIGKWVVVGSGSGIATSTNGTSWTAASSIGLLNNVSGVAYGNGYWFAVGGGRVVAKSTDNGTNWVAVPNANTNGMTSGSGVAYGLGRWVIVGSDTREIMVSLNGTSFFPIAGSNRGGIDSFGSAVAFGNGYCVIVGGGVVSYSTDGLVWNYPTGSTGNIGPGYGVAYGNGRWVIVGKGSIIATSTTDIRFWTAVPAGTALGGITTGRGVAYGNGIWVVVGEGSGIAYSTNGTSWVEVPVADRGGITTGYGVTYGNGLWVVVGEGSIIATSTSGFSWTAVPQSDRGSITAGYGIAFIP
jgi:hypothetical protein